MSKVIIDAYERTRSVKATAKQTNLSEKTVIKVLVTHGIYPTNQATAIASMRDDGMTADQIANHLGVQRKSVECYLPYTKGSYALGDKTDNARRIALWRSKKEKRKPHQ